MASAILPPEILPEFFVEGHGIDELDIFETIEMGAGHTRKRGFATAARRIVTVQQRLYPVQMLALDDFFENVLLAGERVFTATVASEEYEGLRYWDARWLEPYTAEPINIAEGLFWLVSGALVLTGNGSTTRPVDTEMAVEVDLPLFGSFDVERTGEMAVEVSLPLYPALPFAVEVSLPLGQYVPSLRLREAVDYRLREGSGRRLREADG